MCCARRHRELLAGAQRLLRRTCLYYALPPGQPPPDMLEVLQQVPPRHCQVPTDKQAGFALYMFTHKGAFLRKRAVNVTRVALGRWRPCPAQSITDQRRVTVLPPALTPGCGHGSPCYRTCAS